MLKKMILVAVVGGLAVAAFKGTKFASYLRQEWSGVKDWADDQIPPEKEISRLRNELKSLDGDMLRVVNQLAKEKVEVAELKKTIDELASKQSAAKELLNARAKAIKDAETRVTSGDAGAVVVFGDRKVGLTAAKAELADGVKRFGTNQKSLETLTATQAARERIRDGLEKQLDALKNQKAEMATAIDALEAELTMLKVQQMESKFQTDDSRLARIKEDMRALRKKVDVEREKLKLMPAAYDDTASPAAAGQSVDDIMAPVNSPRQAPVKPEAKTPASTD